VNLSSVWKLAKEWGKTLAAFVAGVVTTMILNLVNGNTVWPKTGAEWLQYVLTSFGAAIAVALTRNKITQKQLDKDPNVVGGTVVPDEQIPPAAPAGSYQNPWK
jgi:lipopolysaccharide export LptBFGC system permease protein LptF